MFREIPLGRTKGKRRTYIRVFRDPENIRLAKKMLLCGYSQSEVSRVLRVDHTSIMIFKRRCRTEGIFFPDSSTKKSERGPEFVIRVPSIIKIQKSESIILEENINRGKTCYNDYLRDYKEKVADAEKQRMETAKETIRKIHEKRKQEGTTVWQWDWEIDVF
jgi:hypothetical protein